MVFGLWLYSGDMNSAPLRSGCQSYCPSSVSLTRNTLFKTSTQQPLKALTYFLKKSKHLCSTALNKGSDYTDMLPLTMVTHHIEARRASILFVFDIFKVALSVQIQQISL